MCKEVIQEILRAAVQHSSSKLYVCPRTACSKGHADQKVDTSEVITTLPHKSIQTAEPDDGREPAVLHKSYPANRPPSS